eukprot:gene3115-3895_t
MRIKPSYFVQSTNSIFENTEFANKVGLNNPKSKDIESKWTLNNINTPKIIWCRAGQIKTSISGKAEIFAQICVKFSGSQSLTVKDKKGGKILSNVENSPFTDYYVFERCVSAVPSSWKISGSIQQNEETSKLPLVIRKTL